MKKALVVFVSLFVLVAFGGVNRPVWAADTAAATDTTDASTSTDDASYYEKLLQSLQILRSIMDELTTYLGGSSAGSDTTASTTDTGGQTDTGTGTTTEKTTTEDTGSNVDLSDEYPTLLGGSKTTNSKNTKDADDDGVPDGQDKCAKSTSDGSGLVNQNPSSPDYGCNCAQIQAKGGYQQQTTCPGQSCSTSFLVTYTQTPGSCNNGNATQPQCVANQTPDQNCDAIYQQQQQQKAAQDAQKDSQTQEMMKQAMEALKKMMSGEGQKPQGGQCNQACKCPDGKDVPKGCAAQCCEGSQVKKGMEKQCCSGNMDCAKGS
jgi:hypothetical protein